MKTWDDWGDEEISSKIMGILHGEQVEHWCLSECGEYVYDCGPTGEQFYKVDVFDINSWADMGPLIIENKITVVFNGSLCECGGEFADLSGVEGGGYCFDGHSCEHENPLRAAAIVFLMMNGVKPCSQS